MNLGKIKTFLITLFLGINIYLIISLMLSSAFRIDDKTIENTVKILNDAKIGINKSVIPKKAVNLNNIETKNVIYTSKFKKNESYDKFKLSNDSFVAEFKDDSMYKKSEKSMQKTIKRLLEGCGFDTKFMKFSQVKNTENGKNLIINCYIGKYCFFDNYIDVNISKDGYSISGKWYNPQSTDVKSNSKSREMVYITGVLIDFKDNEQVKKDVPITVKSIDYGYMSGSLYGNTGHVAATALPYYRITDNKGNIYYYDATEGTYNSIK